MDRSRCDKFADLPTSEFCGLLRKFCGFENFNKIALFFGVTCQNTIFKNDLQLLMCIQIEREKLKDSDLGIYLNQNVSCRVL